eukprot:2470475-Prymnesium_polylepis.3
MSKRVRASLAACYVRAPRPCLAFAATRRPPPAGEGAAARAQRQARAEHPRVRRRLHPLPKLLQLRRQPAARQRHADGAARRAHRGRERRRRGGGG